MYSKGPVIVTTGGEQSALNYECEHFPLPSRFGSDSGRISKLWIYEGEPDEDYFLYNDDGLLCHYDRAWALEPKNEKAEKALAILKRKFN